MLLRDPRKGGERGEEDDLFEPPEKKKCQKNNNKKAVAKRTRFYSIDVGNNCLKHILMCVDIYACANLCAPHVPLMRAVLALP
jgi:hypothetical protein